MTFLSCPRCFCRCLRTPLNADEPVRLTCRACGASQTFAPKKSKQDPDKINWLREGPYTMACGCNSVGQCCEEEERLFAAFEAAKKADGDRPPGKRSPHVTEQLAAYHAHFC